MHRCVAWIFVGSLLCACGSEQSELDEARARWKSHGFEHYELWASQCDWGECTGEVHVVVNEAGVTAERTDPPGPGNSALDPSDFTVEAYFEFVQRSIGRGDLAHAAYDEELGFVWVAAIDGESDAVITAHDLKRL